MIVSCLRINRPGLYIYSNIILSVKNILSIILVFFLSHTCCAQKSAWIVFDTLPRPGLPQKNAYYLSETKFSQVDTATKWTYFFDTGYGKQWKDSIKPLGLIEFWRTEPLDDSISKFIHGKWWTPRIRFEIYHARDSMACFKKSTNIRFFSSCVPPDVGGDIILAGDFLFLSKGACLSCKKYDTGEDYCRPVINQLFQRLIGMKKKSLSALIDALAIPASKTQPANM